MEKKAPVKTGTGTLSSLGKSGMQMGTTKTTTLAPVGGAPAPTPAQAAPKPVGNEKKEKSREDIINEKQISQVEKDGLKHVFSMLEYSVSVKGKPVGQGYFTAREVALMLSKLGLELSKEDIDLMIWEVDENLDGKVDWYEYELMYKRCIYDETGLEPKSLFNMVQFLMYVKDNKTNREGHFVITEEDTLELIIVRKGRAALEEELEAIFGRDDIRSNTGEEKELTFAEYLERVNKRALQMRKELEKKTKQAYMRPPESKKKKDEDN
eukprot:TRINITY_DN1207_c0_g1_i1.p1 TRINITY_DN1207_c0_g1~~TRINITY_DN1207_c0_g1_i1.p1  ORF type:complete len:267 (-),score=81.60 TRINITY_DN1207_c0_g1_i1:111-911(-)